MMLKAVALNDSCQLSCLTLPYCASVIITTSRSYLLGSATTTVLVL